MSEYQVLGIITALALGVVAYAVRSSNQNAQQLAALLGPLVESIKLYADKGLAPFGVQLAPLHEQLVEIETLIDDDDDYLVRLLKRPKIIAALREILDAGQELTDGVPPPVETAADA